MSVLDAMTRVCSPARVAKLAGSGTGHVVRTFRTTQGTVSTVLRLVPSPRLFKPAPHSFKAVLRQAILKETQRAGRSLSEKEVDDLVSKISTLLEKVFNGELGIDAIPCATELLGSKDALTAVVMPLLKSAGPFSESRLEMLKQILVENIQLQNETIEEEATHE